MANPRDDRFAFNRSGYFRCSREQERIELAAAQIGIILLLAANLLVLGLRAVLVFPTVETKNPIEALLVSLLTEAPPLLLFSGAEYLLFRIFRRRVYEGILYYYFADEAFFSFRCPARRLNFSVKYEDVVSIEYYKRYAFRLPRGYTVILETQDGKRQRFPCLSHEKGTQTFSEKPAPFPLLEERIEKMRREKREENFGRLPY